MVWKGRWLPIPRLAASPHLIGSPLVAYKQNPNNHQKDALSTNPVVSSFLARAFAPNLYNLVQSFSSWPLLLHHWPPNLVTWKTRHLELTSRLRPHPLPSRGWKDPKEMGASGSAPSHSPSWPLARKPLPSHPNTRHCLGIHVTLTKETGATPPPHAWMVPLVEDMLCYGRTGLTKAVVMGLDRAVLFYGRWSMGEGLSLGEARDATFTLTGAGIWVGKPAYLATDPLTIIEGQQTIAQAITECQIEARGPGQPCLNLSNPQPFRFYHPGYSPQKDCPRDASLTINHHPAERLGLQSA